MCRAGISERDIERNDVGFGFVPRQRKLEALGDFQAALTHKVENRDAFRRIGRHVESPKHLAGLETNRADGQRATAVQRDIFLVLAHVHSQHDLFDAAGVIIENKLGAFAFEALSPGRHGGW